VQTTGYLYHIVMDLLSGRARKLISHQVIAPLDCRTNNEAARVYDHVAARAFKKLPEQIL
jgi:hypothetical protein